MTKQELTWHVIHRDDLSATIRYRMLCSTECYFEAREWLGRADDGSIVFVSDDREPTDDVELASLLASGTVKWDGCTNIDFHTNDCQRHLCSIEDVRQFGAMLETIYCEAARLLSESGTWNGEVPSLNR